eukprot:967866-Prorocentrum_minimum.AAC.1
MAVCRQGIYVEYSVEYSKCRALNGILVSTVDSGALSPPSEALKKENITRAELVARNNATGRYGPVQFNLKCPGPLLLPDGPAVCKVFGLSWPVACAGCSLLGRRALQECPQGRESEVAVRRGKTGRTRTSSYEQQLATWERPRRFFVLFLGLVTPLEAGSDE